MVIEEEESLKDYYDLLKQYRSLKSEVREIVFSPKYCLPFLQPGRLAQILCTTDSDIPSYTVENDTTWGVIINFNKVKRPGEGICGSSIFLCYFQQTGVFWHKSLAECAVLGYIF